LFDNEPQSMQGANTYMHRMSEMKEQR
jgi:hypothetical protein